MKSREVAEVLMMCGHEKKDEDCDGVLSMDLREGWHSERVSATVAL